VTGTRPAVVVVVAGTGTDVGKTWVSARLLEAWSRAGLSVAARKPAQSFAPGAGPTDSEVLAAATGEDPTTVCRPERSYPLPLAPPMAASALGRPGPTISDLVGEIVWPGLTTDVGLVETAGGVRSPQADDGDVMDMALAIAPDHVVLVADAGLGTINAVRLSLDALVDGGVRPEPLVVLNRYDPSSDLHRRNLAWLRDVDAIPVVPGTDLVSLADRLAPPAPPASATQRGPTSIRRS
jgi:dethiobiotin synthetase